MKMKVSKHKETAPLSEVAVLYHKHRVNPREKIERCGTYLLRAFGVINVGQFGLWHWSLLPLLMGER